MRGNEFGYLAVGGQQHPLAIGTLHHHVGERPQRRLRPYADDEPHTGGRAEPGDMAVEDPATQVPVHFGARFSANAIAPSFASLLLNTGIRIFTCSANIVSGLQPRDSVMIRLVAATASGPLAVIRSASSIAASSTWPGSARTLTSPRASARSADRLSPVSASSIAIAGGMRCGSRSRPPPPATRPRFTSGMPNSESFAATIRSVASASSIPPASP